MTASPPDSPDDGDVVDPNRPAGVPDRSPPRRTATAPIVIGVVAVAVLALLVALLWTAFT